MNRAVVGGLVLIVAASFASRVLANGGTPRLINAAAGPYLVSAWTEPGPPRVGRLDVSIAVTRPASGAFVLDAGVRVDAEPLDGLGKTPTATATRGAGGNLLIYHAELEMPSEGQWQVKVTVNGPQGSGSAAFQLQVTRPPSMKWLGVGVGGGVAGLILLWLVWRARRPASPYAEASRYGG